MLFHSVFRCVNGWIALTRELFCFCGILRAVLLPIAYPDALAKDLLYDADPSLTRQVGKTTSRLLLLLKSLKKTMNVWTVSVSVLEIEKMK